MPDAHRKRRVANPLCPFNGFALLVPARNVGTLPYDFSPSFCRGLGATGLYSIADRPGLLDCLISCFFGFFFSRSRLSRLPMTCYLWPRFSHFCRLGLVQTAIGADGPPERPELPLQASEIFQANQKIPPGPHRGARSAIIWTGAVDEWRRDGFPADIHFSRPHGPLLTLSLPCSRILKLSRSVETYPHSVVSSPASNGIVHARRRSSWFGQDRPMLQRSSKR